MDPHLQSAAQALAAGDLLGALNFIAVRDDAPALAMRGIAMARLGDFSRAKILLQRAARIFGAKEPVARARCVVALTEIAFVSRDLGSSIRPLASARAVLEAQGDRLNAAHARHLEVRYLLLTGRVHEAERALGELDPTPFPPALRAAHELVVAGIAVRGLRTKEAQAAFTAAKQAALLAGIPALSAEVESASLVLQKPAARLVTPGQSQLLLLDEVETLLQSQTLVVDAFSHAVRNTHTSVSLARRPVLFALARALAEAWPGDVTRNSLIAQAFQAKSMNESHRARLRVEIGRLRLALRKLGDIHATMRGFALTPRGMPKVAVLAWPVEEEHAPILGLLADGESWSSSALSTALGASQRTIQRALDDLATTGKVKALGRARAQRWVMPIVPEFTTILLLPAPLPVD